MAKVLLDTLYIELPGNIYLCSQKTEASTILNIYLTQYLELGKVIICKTTRLASVFWELVTFLKRIYYHFLRTPCNSYLSYALLDIFRKSQILSILSPRESMYVVKPMMAILDLISSEASV